jgi:hypothetical protein
MAPGGLLGIVGVLQLLVGAMLLVIAIVQIISKTRIEISIGTRI